ncbi:hypothetical protein BAE44_0006407 [Dichanthelium oligosanthes]|uniref:RRM domain-containing protein n=1 Tax=Dichanthelium oligosanthes TaxID=888268 RepID=A0A1E5W5D7_9POAL|nr:hypothetical protein BAE44_0006407 [Dichanthelium oligosanthes]
MDGYDAGGQLAAASPSPHPEDAIAAVRDDAHARLRTPSDDEDCDDLYGDVNVGFLPLLPLSPSPAPTSPPKTPSPGCSIPSPSPPPRRAPASEPQREPEPQPLPKPATPRHQPPRPPPPTPAPPRHHVPPQPQPQRAPRGGGGASYSSPPPRYTALYISDLHWWTTDAEVEAALGGAAHGAATVLCGLHFYSDKSTGKSRGICRAEFLHAAAAASAAAVLHGRAFHGRHCVASLTRPAALQRLGDDSDSCAEAARAPNLARGLGSGGRGASNATTVRGNVGPALGDRPILAPPPLPVVPRPSPGPPFGGIVGGVGGYGGFQSMVQYNAGMVPSAVAPHVNPSFLAAGGMAMQGPGVWHDQVMAGGFWGAQQGWNFRGCQMPWQQLAPQAQQQYGNRDYGKGRGRRQDRTGNRSEERGIGNESYPNRMQADRDGGDWYKEHDHEEKGRHRKRVLEKEREQERHWNERDRHGGGKRHQEYTERADFDRRGRVRSRSQSRDDGDDDHPRRRR